MPTSHSALCATTDLVNLNPEESKQKRCHQEQQGNKQIDCCWERQVVGCSSFAEPASIFRLLARHYVLQLGFVFVCLALSVLVLVFVFVLRSSSVFIRCCGYFAHYFCYLALAQIWLLNHYNWGCLYLDFYYIDFGVLICDNMSLSLIFCHPTSLCSDLVSATVITTHPGQIFHFSQSERSSQCRKRMTWRLLLLDKYNFLHK